MQYFKDFPRVEYVFGDQIDIGGQSVTTEIYQDISAYVDIIDEVKNNSSFYTFYNVQDGDRPDQVSNTLYGSNKFYWTFYYINDGLRRQGWPLSYRELDKKVKEIYPNRTLVIREHLLSKFQVGQTITGSTSGATGIILRRNLDLGQIIVKPTNSNTFQAEVITNTVDGITEEHCRAYGYRLDENGWVNFPDWQGRIFRNRPNIRWEKKVHEQIIHCVV